MAGRTIHVYRSDLGWEVKKQGKRADVYGTKREAVAMAVRKARKAKAAQLAVYGKDGRMVDYRAYGMPRIQAHPKKSSMADEIERAVHKIVMARLRADGLPPRVHASSQ